jgi:cell wall-associated NlpC family hydrolase
VSTRGRTKALAICAAAALTFGLGPAALADHNPDPTIPTKDQVTAAQRDAASAKLSVKAIEAQLSAASQQLNDLDIAAEQAAEAFNGARIAWHDAEAAAVAARRRAVLAQKNAATARHQLAGYLVTTDSSGSELSSFSMALSADGPHRLLREMSQADTSKQTLDARLQRWRATTELVKVYRAAAEAALSDARIAKHRADKARAAAAAAVAAQRAAVVSIGAQRQVLLAELAHAQHVSVALAAQRQRGLERRREARRREQQRQELLAQERRVAREARQAREARRQQRQRHHQPTPTPDPGGGGGPAAPPAPAPPAPAPPVPAPPAPPPTSTGDAQAAVNFAYAQLGEPYVWGAAGPDSWDCSGLTMGAWAAAGVYLPHYTVSQYYATTPVSFSDLRPGDLIFWASDPSNPNTIFHVAMYIGNGQEIQAPHTGENVMISDVFSWESPDFFTRP